MYNHQLHQQIKNILVSEGVDLASRDNLFFTRCIANATTIHTLFHEIYYAHQEAETSFEKLIRLLCYAYRERPARMKERDEHKMEQKAWFLDNGITGMSLYVDRFCGSIPGLNNKLSYFAELGINLLHLMPVFESPEDESDGGYAVSNFRLVDKKFGTLEDLRSLQEAMQEQKMYLVLDIVLNHTSNVHEWAKKAKSGDKKYQEYYFMFDDREFPDRYDQYMPDIFPASAPGNFTYDPTSGKWVMTVFHQYQWDLNYTNPAVLLEMLDNILFYANIGVDILRIDAPAFIWKEIGTACQNLPQAHTLLRLIRQCVHVSAPGMALLGEAIVAPKEIMKYFGTGLYTARECDFAYNATHMALQWDALASKDTRVMLAAQHELLQKPYGTSWINYTRCHDDIGLGYEDYMIRHAGYDPTSHRKFLMQYYTGEYPGSPSTGALFSSNPKTGDARISGSLASLCGLEKAMASNDEKAIGVAIKKILMMQAHSFLLGGIPMLFYGDEVGYTNDYSYLSDPGKSYDSRWMHRPLINWQKNEKSHTHGTVEQQIFSGTQKLIAIRRHVEAVSDLKNLTWLTSFNKHVAGYLRTYEGQRLYCLFNFSDEPASVSWSVFMEHSSDPSGLWDHWEGREYEAGSGYDLLQLEGYQFMVLEVIS